MNLSERDAEILAIARGILRLTTLEPRNRDALDFHDLSVWQVREALEAAYAAGYRAARGGESGTAINRPDPPDRPPTEGS